MEVASFSACSTNVALVPLTALDCASRVAKCWRRRLSNLLREDEKRFQRSASAFLSKRGAAFHSSRSVFKRSPVAFQLSESARDSASAMIFSFASIIPVRRSAFAAASAAFFASCAARPPSISGRIWSTEFASALKSPTPLRFSTCLRNLSTACIASEGTIAPLFTRAARRTTSDASTSNLRTK
ncbi:unannotated protein [freshwater metagenome]|uniref:Unannotated protein n=1 Tax=freshwater metagenome TaxID=449393 RepID=A0A6J7J7G7_9ZZZZ